MKPKIARRILRKNHLKIVRETLSPSEKKLVNEAIRVAVKAEVSK